jgi:hypothetical protein
MQVMRQFEHILFCQLFVTLFSATSEYTLQDFFLKLLTLMTTLEGVILLIYCYVNFRLDDINCKP